MDRREFLAASAAALAAASARRAVAGDDAPPAKASPLSLASADWPAIRAQFDLPPDKVHLCGFFLASVPRPVKAEIERHRAKLDVDPVTYFIENHNEFENNVRRVAGRYMDVDGVGEIALTDSTTMGLGLLYSGITLREGDEIVTSEHDHYATHDVLAFRAARSGVVVRRVRLYAAAASASVDRIVSTIRAALTPRTRVLALTWVHSCTGVKMPIAQISAAVAEENARRDAADRVLFCVDGVHGFGFDDATIPQLGCDFFAAGTHKWMLGPRGTGVLWGRPDAWQRVSPSITPFSDRVRPSGLHTPGGFHTFENRWAADAAFRFHLDIGKSRVAQRLHALNRQVREGLAAMSHVTLHTPMSDELAGGITCFEVRGLSVKDTASRLWSKGVMASASPYDPSYARLAACMWNTEDEVDRALDEVRRLA